MASDKGVIGGTVPRVVPHPVSTIGAIGLVLRSRVAGSRIAVTDAITIGVSRVVVAGPITIAMSRRSRRNQSGPAPPSQTSLSWVAITGAIAVSGVAVTVPVASACIVPD